jgi:hypothetical protein
MGTLMPNAEGVASEADETPSGFGDFRIDTQGGRCAATLGYVISTALRCVVFTKEMRPCF